MRFTHKKGSLSHTRGGRARIAPPSSAHPHTTQRDPSSPFNATHSLKRRKNNLENCRPCIAGRRSPSAKWSRGVVLVGWWVLPARHAIHIPACG